MLIVVDSLCIQLDFQTVTSASHSKALEEEHDMAGRGGGSISSAVTAHITGGYNSKGGVQRPHSHAHQHRDCKGSERTVNFRQDVTVILLLDVQLQPHRGSSD